MHTTLAWRVYVDSVVGSTVSLQRAGTGLEHPLVFDASVRDIKAMAQCGLVSIVSEKLDGQQGGQMISELLFTRIR